MRFGFLLPNLLSPVSYAAAIKTSTQLAENVGFDSIWATDHILMPSEYPQYGKGTEAITTLAYLAGLTERVALGLSVLVLPMRNPIIVAKQLASLAHLSGREVIVGLGVGWNEVEYGYLNADFKQRGKLLDEYIDIMRKLWTNEHPEHDGTHTFSGATIAPTFAKPLSIWIGGESDAAIKRAAALGDGYHPDTKPGQAYGDSMKRVREMRGDKPIIRMKVDMNEGTAAVIERLSALREDGLEYPAVGFKHETLSELVGQLEAFGRDVIPALRD